MGVGKELGMRRNKTQRAEKIETGEKKDLGSLSHQKQYVFSVPGKYCLQKSQFGNPKVSETI